MTDRDVLVATSSDENSVERPDRSLTEQLAEQARSGGKNLVGSASLLSTLTKQFLETGLEAGVVEHLGYPKHVAGGATVATLGTGPG